MVGSVIASVVAAALIAAVSLLYRYRGWIRVLVPGIVTARSFEVRVSIASIVRVECDGEYMLFRTPLRPEAFAPPGGVVKFFPEAQSELDDMAFRPQLVHGPVTGRGLRDLRGYIAFASLPRLIRWYGRGTDRESHTDALRRELREEAAEVGIPALGDSLSPLPLRRVRRVIEGPTRAAKGYLQVRVIEVYEVSESDRVKTEALCRDVRAVSDGNPNILFAAADVITKGRSGRDVIGHHACYLYGARQLRGELPPL
jgi:hypothetical protein